MTELGFMPQLETLLQRPVRQELAFPNSEYRERVDRVIRGMRTRAIDVFITGNNPTICYLTGFQYTNTDYANFLLLREDGYAAMVVAGTEVATVLVHGWIRDVKEFASWDPVESLPLVSGYIEEWQLGAAHIGIDQSHEVFDPRAYQRLRANFPKAKFTDASDIVAGFRTIKSPAEISHLQKAAYYSDLGILAALTAVQTGSTENIVAAEASRAMIEAGSEYFSTAPLVSAGRRTSLAAAMFRRTKIEPKDVVRIELGGVFQRYSAPISRTVVVGKPTKEFMRLADASMDCLKTLLKRVEPKRPIADVAKLLRRKLRLLNDKLVPIPSFGCSIGVNLAPTWREDWLQIEENNVRRFEEGMVFYSPIPLCISGKVGVCFGESWVVTAEGAQRLSHLPLADYGAAT